MNNPSSNLKSFPDRRSQELFLDALWEMSDDVSPDEIRLACKDARKLALSGREDASAWREVMDNLFTLWLGRREA